MGRGEFMDEEREEMLEVMRLVPLLLPLGSELTTDDRLEEGAMVGNCARVCCAELSKCQNVCVCVCLCVSVSRPQ